MLRIVLEARVAPGDERVACEQGGAGAKRAVDRGYAPTVGRVVHGREVVDGLGGADYKFDSGDGEAEIGLGIGGLSHALDEDGADSVARGGE